MRYRTLRLQSALVICLLLSWIGCDSFLEPDPASFSTTVNFYETPAQFEQAINGVYAVFRTLIANEDHRHLTDMRGPNITKHFDVNLPGTVGGDPQVDEWTMTVANVNVETEWDNVYDLVKEANVVLDRIPDVEFEDPALKDRITGEAKAMRAYAYWLAAQLWGDVPLLLEAPDTPDEAFYEGGRTPVTQVYNQVIADLQDAVAKLPVSYSGEDVGRITQGAARFLLGRTYLLTGDYAAALAEFQALDAAPYSYQLLEDYHDIFNPALKNNAESVWEIQFSNSITGQPDLDILEEIVPWNSDDDLGPANITPDGDYHPTPDIINDYEQGDGRYEASIAWYVKEGNNQYLEIAFGDSLPYLNKFYWPEHVDDGGEMDMNWVLFRFADVLLSAAEAHWRLGSEAEALSYINRVRERAGLGPVDLAAYSGQWTGSALGDALLQERMIEFLGEGHSWLDLKRFGDETALRVMEAHSLDMRTRDSKVSQAYVIEPRGLLYPIPQGDVVLAGLTQNPGW